MYFTQAKGADLRRDPNTSQGSPSCGDLLILKVAGGLDRNGRWFYEDIDSDPELLPGQLALYFTQMAPILAEVPGQRLLLADLVDTVGKLADLVKAVVKIVDALSLL